jgi:alpha-tubulin suppressor-like RCC1 family protein
MFGNVGFFDSQNFFIPVKEYAMGDTHSLIIKPDGSLWTVGRNTYGQTGLGTTTGNTTTLTRIGLDNNWKSVTALRNSEDSGDVFGRSIAVKTNGTLWSWGLQANGGLGDGVDGFTSTTIPIQVGSDTNWDKVSAGPAHVLAIKTNGTLWSWGRNVFFRTGLNTDLDNTLVPTQITSTSPSSSNNDWAAISAGGSFSLALKTDGTLWSFGWDNNGRTGQGLAFSGDFSEIPTRVGSDNNWIKISAGNRHSLVLKSNGELWGFGLDTGFALLSPPSMIGGSVYEPALISPFTDWIDISAGYDNSFGIRANGTLWSWGANTELFSSTNNGKLGLGIIPETERNFVTQIGTANNWVSVEVSNRTGFAFRNNRSLWGWGARNPGNNTAVGTPEVNVTEPRIVK